MKSIHSLLRYRLQALVLFLVIGYGIAVMSTADLLSRVKDGGRIMPKGMGGMGAVPRLSLFLLDNYCADLKARNNPMYKKNCFTGEDEDTVPEDRQRRPSFKKQSYPPRLSYYRPMNLMAQTCFYTFTWWYPQLVCHPFHPFYV